MSQETRLGFVFCFHLSPYVGCGERVLNMHIEPGIVEGTKVTLSYATATGALMLGASYVMASLRRDGLSLAIRALCTTFLAVVFFEVFPHYPVGVSEVHFILGSTLFLVFGIGATAIGLSCALLLQGIMVSPLDLPQYGMNVTTLLVPLFVMGYFARRFIPSHVAYKDLSYRSVLSLSAVYQLGIISWVSFWVFYGQGFTSVSFHQIGIFSLAYLSVIVIEPVIDLSVLSWAKLSSSRGVFNVPRLCGQPVLVPRLFTPS